MAQIELQLASVGRSATRPMTATAAPKASFANVLADAVGTAGPARSAAAGRLNADGVPVDLAAYGNGKVPPSALKSVGSTGHRLWAPAASALESLLQAARQDGVHIGITDSYRSYDEQVDLARRKGLYSQGGLAAKPGTSNHGWGLSADLDLNSKAQAWMKANGARYGFVADTPREPWHWTFTPKA
jgi:D-alanyl-D-alanine carboxypeptidase